MTKEALQKEHGDLYNEIFAAGASAERARIEGIFKSVPAEALQDERVVALAFDGESTATDIKATLYDLEQEKRTATAAQIETDGEQLAAQLHDVGTAPAAEQNTEKEQSEKLAAARAKAIEEINKRRGV